MRNQKVSHLKEGFGSRSPGLQHNGQDGEDDDLDGRTASVPVWPTDTILQQWIFLIWCYIFNAQIFSPLVTVLGKYKFWILGQIFLVYSPIDCIPSWFEVNIYTAYIGPVSLFWVMNTIETSKVCPQWCRRCHVCSGPVLVLTAAFLALHTFSVLDWA